MYMNMAIGVLWQFVTFAVPILALTSENTGQKTTKKVRDTWNHMGIAHQT